MNSRAWQRAAWPARKRRSSPTDDWRSVDRQWQDNFFHGGSTESPDIAHPDWRDADYFGTGQDMTQQYERGYSGLGPHGFANYAMEAGANADWENAAAQSQRGKAPKGYERSDERLREIICERLTDDPRIDPGDVTIAVTGRSVVLSGTVDSRRTKYEIEELVDRCGAVTDIDNRLRIASR